MGEEVSLSISGEGVDRQERLTLTSSDEETRSDGACNEETPGSAQCSDRDGPKSTTRPLRTSDGYHLQVTSDIVRRVSIMRRPGMALTARRWGGRFGG